MVYDADRCVVQAPYVAGCWELGAGNVRCPGYGIAGGEYLQYFVPRTHGILGRAAPLPASFFCAMFRCCMHACNEHIPPPARDPDEPREDSRPRPGPCGTSTPLCRVQVPFVFNGLFLNGRPARDVFPVSACARVNRPLPLQCCYSAALSLNMQRKRWSETIITPRPTTLRTPTTIPHHC